MQCAITVVGVLRRGLLRVGVVGLVALSLPAYSMESGSATESLKQTIDQVLTVLADEKMKSPEQAEARLALLERVLSERFDYEEMGKRTLGRHWKKMNEPQRKEFVTLFHQFLSRTYAGNIDGYAGEKVDYLKERRKGPFAEVQTKVVSEKVQVPLDYRLLKKSDTWRVYDVIIDGISLVKNFRGQFNRIIQSSSYDGLLEKLREKISTVPTVAH